MEIVQICVVGNLGQHMLIQKWGNLISVQNADTLIYKNIFLLSNLTDIYTLIYISLTLYYIKPEHNHLFVLLPYLWCIFNFFLLSLFHHRFKSQSCAQNFPQAAFMPKYIFFQCLSLWPKQVSWKILYVLQPHSQWPK